MAILASANDLRAVRVATGDLELSWVHPDDIAANAILFDVFASADLADPFRSSVAVALASLQVVVPARLVTGDRYLTVVARRGDALALPSRALWVAGAPVATTVPAASARPRAGDPTVTGFGFPFHITLAGGVYAQGGDPLLRGKILQLLLTSPGERVNRPDYGTRLLDLVFDPNSDVLAATTEFMITRALQQFFADEIQVERVQLTNTEETLFVDIAYVKKADLRLEQVRVGVPLPERLGA